MKIPQKFLQKVDTCIHINLTETHLIPQLAETCNLSQSQIYRKIKKSTGKTPSTYIRQKRLAIATHLILNTDWTLSQIAYAVGFTSLAYFSRSFALEYGFPPSKLRKLENAR